MSELKTNPNAEVTVIEEVEGCRVIVQFKNYKDFVDYQNLSGRFNIENNATPQMVE